MTRKNPRHYKLFIKEVPCLRWKNANSSRGEAAQLKNNLAAEKSAHSPCTTQGCSSWGPSSFVPSILENQICIPHEILWNQQKGYYVAARIQQFKRCWFFFSHSSWNFSCISTYCLSSFWNCNDCALSKHSPQQKGTIFMIFSVLKYGEE